MWFGAILITMTWIEPNFTALTSTQIWINSYFLGKMWPYSECNSIKLPPGHTNNNTLIPLSDRLLVISLEKLSGFITGLMLIRATAGEKTMKALIVMMTLMATTISPKCFDASWLKKKTLPLSSTIQGHLSSSNDRCNHPFCLPGPSVFPLPWIRINLGSFILIVSYLLNWQSQRRTTETKHIFNMSPSTSLCDCII